MKYKVKQKVKIRITSFIYLFSQILHIFTSIVTSYRCNCIILLFIHNKSHRIYPIVLLPDIFKSICIGHRGLMQ